MFVSGHRVFRVAVGYVTQILLKSAYGSLWVSMCRGIRQTCLVFPQIYCTNIKNRTVQEKENNPMRRKDFSKGLESSYSQQASPLHPWSIPTVLPTPASMQPIARHFGQRSYRPWHEWTEHQGCLGKGLSAPEISLVFGPFMGLVT